MAPPIMVRTAGRSAAFHAPGTTVTREAIADIANAATARGGATNSVASGMKISADPNPANP
jgi:uncharacterized protein (DUF2342 family)